MAITKIHAIKATVHKSIEYICNPHKTDNRILVDTFACGIESAADDFRFANMFSLEQDSKNHAFHLIQSFAPGEVSFEEAHKIGIELADRILKNNYSYVLATHIDHEHIHNHIVFCATDNINHEHYHDCKKTYYEIRNESDRLCKEHGLTIVIPGKQRGKSYKEWLADKNGGSIKYHLKCDIFDSIKSAKSYEDFIELMKLKGYEIKGEELTPDAPKYISFKPANYDKFFRGFERTLGKGYSKEEIHEKIEKQIQSRELWKEKQRNLPLFEQNLIDTTSGNIADNEGLMKWAELRNLQIAASTYAKSGSINELTSKISENEEKCKLSKSRVKELDTEIKNLSEIIKYAKQYEDNKPFQDEYSKSKNPEEYLIINETHLLLFAVAEEQLKRHGLKPEETDSEDLIEKLNELTQERNIIKSDYLNLEAELKELKSKYSKMQEYLKFEEKEQEIQEEKHEKKEQSR